METVTLAEIWVPAVTDPYIKELLVEAAPKSSWQQRLSKVFYRTRRLEIRFDLYGWHDLQRATDDPIKTLSERAVWWLSQSIKWYPLPKIFSVQSRIVSQSNVEIVVRITHK